MSERQETGWSRRRVLTTAAVVGGASAVVGAGVARATAPAAPTPSPTAVADGIIDPYGEHQAGVATPVRSNSSFVAFTLGADSDAASLGRLLRIWTDDIVRLVTGRPALADPVPELAAGPARLTITVGFGAAVFDLAGVTGAKPAWLAPLPALRSDALEDRWSGGDLILQIAADDPVTVSHAQQVLITDAQSFASVKWIQQGFHRPVGTMPEGAVGRNLMGQVDGIVNPVPGTPEFDTIVWSTTPPWLVGGTGMVIRRIAMDLTTWGALDEKVKDQSIGRRTSDGAPLSGGNATTPVDLNAVDDKGLAAIPSFSHVRLAMPADPREKILRRPYNYDDGLPANAGLIFVAFAADPALQYVPIHQRLDTADLLTKWTKPIGSAVFAVPPGFPPGGSVGQTLLGA